MHIQIILPRIILVHGLFMGRHAMLVLSNKLKKDGFKVEIFSYNTVTGSLHSSADKLAKFIQKDTSPVVIIGHSLGGIICIQAMQNVSIDHVSAIVLLGCPYQGAKAAKILRRFTGGKQSLIGRSLHDWSDQCKPTTKVPVYSIAGTSSAGLGKLICRFNEPNDGTVTVAETHYPNAISCLMPVSHTGMLFDAQVARQVSTWLKNNIIAND